jgi:benzodiazapine receptor
MPTYLLANLVPFHQHGATLYTIQLFLNLVWTPLFFGLKKPIAASADILALTGTVGYLAYIWGQVDETAGWLLAPYLAWLGLANYLCHGAGYLNDWDFSAESKTKSS